MNASESLCWRCKSTITADWNYCPFCAATLRDTREPTQPSKDRDISFLRDLHGFSWYNRQVAVLALYEIMADVNVLYEPHRTKESIPLVEQVRTQKILRAKMFAEFVAILEAFGILCLAIKARREKSIIWSYMHIEPQEVTQFFDSLLNAPKAVPLYKLLKLPQPSRINRAVSERPEGPLTGFQYQSKRYEAIAANIRIVAELYRGAASVNVRTYNKLKHAFVVIEGDQWISSSLPMDEAHVLVEDDDIEAGRVGRYTLTFKQEEMDREKTNVSRITVMGAELLTLVLYLNELDLLYA